MVQTCIYLIDKAILILLVVPIFVAESTGRKQRMSTGPLKGVETFRAVNCSWPTSDTSVVGLTLFDYEIPNVNVTVNIQNKKCTVNRILGECCVSESDETTVITAVVSDLVVGRTRIFGCIATSFKESFTREVELINVSLSSNVESKEKEKDSSGIFISKALVGGVSFVFAVLFVAAVAGWAFACYRGCRHSDVDERRTYTRTPVQAVDVDNRSGILPLPYVLNEELFARELSHLSDTQDTSSVRESERLGDTGYNTPGSLR